MSDREERTTESRAFSRRTFIKGSTAAAAGAAVALSGGTVMRALSPSVASADDRSQETISFGNCSSGCQGACRLKLRIRDGKLVQTEMHEFSDPAYGGICLKGISHPQNIYNANRLKYPLKRVGARGSGQWERISWDEAIETIGSTWEKLRAEYGDNAIARTTDAGNMEAIGSTMYTRLFTAMNSAAINCALDNATIFWSIRVLGLDVFTTGNDYKDMLNAGCVFVWGGNPAEAGLQQWKFIAGAKKNGAKLVVIDPNFTGTASKADLFVPIRPATDAALALGMMNVVLKEGWTDEPFLKKSTVAPFLVKESDGKFLRQSDLGIEVAEGGKDEPIVWDSASGTHGVVNSVTDPALEGSYVVKGINVRTAYSLLLDRIAEYPPEVASKITDVPVEVIQQLAEMYVKNGPTTVHCAYGLDHYTNGHHMYWALETLASITGNLGRKGASSGSLAMSEGLYVFNAPIPGTASWASAGGAKPANVPITQLPNIMETGQYNGKPLAIKSWFPFRVNPVANTVQRQAILKAIDKLDLLVVADVEMSDTAMFADIVLPVCSWFETWNLYAMYMPFASLAQKSIEPLYESKSDFEIAKLLARRMGFSEGFDVTEEDVVRYLLDNDYARKIGVTYDSLRNGAVLQATTLGLDGVFIHGEGGKFPTETGRVQFYLEDTSPLFDYGQHVDADKEHLPRFEPPSEAWYENPLAKKYPLICINDHTKWRSHTQFGHAPMLRELDPEPTVRLNPSDADSRGIEAGDIVKVYNDRGYVVLKAVVNPGVRPGVVTIPKGWQADQFIAGHYSDLCSITNVSPICTNQTYSDVLVQVEKA